MAVGAPRFPDLPSIAGFKTTATASGIKRHDMVDLLLVEMENTCSVAGVFTQNQVVAAPVEICRARLAVGRARALLVNSGNANARTGPQGMDDALALGKQCAELLGVPESEIFLASTGVIGERLPMEKPAAALPEMAKKLAPGGWQEAAQAIMTTDTFPKGARRSTSIEGASVEVIGIAKGAGMIHPDMATMLSFLFTDAAITQQALQTLLSRAIEESFNSISVDGDTSTNDTVLLFASGAAGHAVIDDPDSPEAAPLMEAILGVCLDLAQAIIRDAEGATKFVTITVSGAKSRADAKQVAFSVAKSPLVKTALFGSDPNWGRILCAVGYAKVPLDVDRIAIRLGDVTVVENGVLSPGYREKDGARVMGEEEIGISIDLGLGDASEQVWTSDLSHGYVTINADYRT
ncbi:MAG: bifunctional glutamate N-acetyltransferase/amino-acid acetyltransferase ArgJ [Magnetococcales bacterium]|nr:bifunctional glutamate N-acetyltransferase/amino-acid acetyltransferase ArgJ [Magnetococcales bacterium]